MAKNDGVDRLYKAVQNYVERHGGKLIVVGGIQVQEWPQDNLGVFHIAVKCMGKKPKLPAEPVAAKGEECDTHQKAK